MISFSFRETGTDNVPTSYATSPMGIMNAVFEKYGAGTPEVVTMLENVVKASFVCHLILEENNKNGTTNEYINVVPLIERDSLMFNKCVDNELVSDWVIDIMLNCDILEHEAGNTRSLKFTTQVQINPYFNNYTLDMGLDAGDVCACMNNMYNVGLDVSPYICSSTECTCGVFNNIYLPHTFC